MKQPKNMKSVTRSATNVDQMDRNMTFDGMTNGSSQGNKTTKYSGNQHGGRAGGNYGRGPTVGNKGCDIEGPKCPPYSAVPALPRQGSVRDSINRGAQVRTPGGTRPFDPKPGQNYSGNADAINVGRGPTKGNAQ